jgi:hypothetical protein
LRELRAALEDAEQLLDTGYWVHLEVNDDEPYWPVIMEIGRVKSNGHREVRHATNIYYTFKDDVRVSTRLHS